MTITVLLLIILGIALISYGANILVTSTEMFSKKYNVSYFLSSFIFIGLATSSPEIFISIVSSLSDKSNIAIGNALGSNIANIAFVFALSYLYLKKDALDINNKIEKETTGSIMFLIIISFSLIPMLADGVLMFNEAIAMIVLFIILIYLYKNIYLNKKNYKVNSDNKYYSALRIMFMLLFGLSLLLIGTEVFLDSSIKVATYFGVSDYVIGLSITAIGSSIPELASSIAAAMRKNIDLIIGNILGSNIFNFTIVLSIAGLLSTSSIQPLNIVDLIRDMIMILITMAGFYIIIKNYNYVASKLLCLLLLGSFVIYQISLYGINI